MKRNRLSAIAFAAVTAAVSVLTLTGSGYTSIAAVPAPQPGVSDYLTARPHPMLVAAKPAPAPARSWTVKSGDTLSGIAKTRYGKETAWPLIFWANHKQIKWANQIQVGQVLALPASAARIPAPPKLLEPPPPPVAVVSSSSTSGSTSGYRATYHRSYRAPVSTYHGGGGYESCVISRESGGNPHAVNPSSGAGGLYQFLPSTWASLGYSGSPQNASVSTQRQAFQRLYAQAGTSPWSPSDGC